MDFCGESKNKAMVGIKTAVKTTPKVHVSELLGLIPDVYIDELSASLGMKVGNTAKGKILKRLLKRFLQADTRIFH